ncbi:MAG TPA: sugar nucleotide-binding protein [Acidimicrobiales bacterium]|nr:sugar nucleotide-binding protein [Acidimicrobiales bacterium]
MVLTGASGLLGTWLRRTVPDGIDLVGVVHRRAPEGIRHVDADLRDEAATRAAIGAVRPDLVIHAAYRLDAPSIVAATRHVTATARDADAHLVFVSSDAVFAGDGLPRAEDAVPDPPHDYGRWKAEAETLVAGLGRRSTIVRLPLLVSLDPPDHVLARIRQGAATRTPTIWFDDELRQPASAAEVAAALWRIVGLDRADRSGVWHLPGPELLSRFAIAQRAVARLGLETSAIVAAPTPAGVVRPRSLVLEGGRAAESVDWSPSPIP